jgi:hypothetical protein
MENLYSPQKMNGNTMYQVMAKGGRRLFFNIEQESDREIEPIEDQRTYIQ